MRVIETLPAPNKVDVFPPHGFVRLVGYFGDELSIVNAARVSFHKESAYVSEPVDSPDLYEHDEDVPVARSISEADQGLLRYLLKNKHGTPFEQGFMAQFHCRVPIFVMREWIRHRIGVSVNEESGRYVEMRPDFYIHEVDHVREQKGKPGAYYYEPTENRGLAEWWRGELDMHSRRGFDLYRTALEHGIAKEVARTCLSLNLYTEFRWTCNARSLMNFLALRNAPPAMQEIRELAAAMEGIFAREMPTVHETFEEAGRVAP